VSTIPAARNIRSCLARDPGLVLSVEEKRDGHCARTSAGCHSGPAAAPGRLPGEAASYAWAAARLFLGWIFLWAFLDKLFGLGHETASKQAWINGGSPTKGFLSHGAKGPFKGFYNDIAGAGWVDWLFMLGLLGLGVTLLLGIAMHVAAAGGALLMLLMWSVGLPPDNNLFMDDHLVYAAVLFGLAWSGAGVTLGLGRWWRGLSLVQRNPWLV
jgi:thiosulfate dehydrogenase (quinone) large subunit